MKRKFIPLIALVPLIIAIFTILTSVTDGRFIFFQDGVIFEEDSIYQTYQSSLAYCKEKFEFESMKENMGYSECINTVEEWYKVYQPGQ